MEYRRRRTRIHRYPRRRPVGGSAYPAYLAAFLVFVLIVYGVSASKLGTWLADKVVAPVMLRMLPDNTALPEPTPTPVVVETAEKTTVTLEAYACDALQIGVYASRENAEAQAESLKALGAAGYLLRDGDRFRVLAAGYGAISDAETVRQRLETQGIDSRIHRLSGPKRTLIIRASAKEADTVRGAAEGMKTLLNGLSDVALRFDRDTMTIDEGVVAVHALQSVAREYAAALREPVQAEPEAIAGFYESMEAEMEQTASIEDRTAFSAALKRLYLTGVIAYCAYLNGD